MKARKFFRILLSAVPFAIIAAIVCAVIFFPKAEAGAAEPKRVVTVWNVDTFEGGKGSRTNFLRQVARRVEKEREGVYFLVVSYTREGAEAAIAEGNLPDLLSFGVGIWASAERSEVLPYSFAGGEIAGKCRAVPWCMGGYFLFSLSEDFEEEGVCAISEGGCNLGVLAAVYAGVKGEPCGSQAAYTGFLSGKYRYLLGTQRDVCRFATRGATVYSRPLTGYNDLFQYISLTKTSHRADALAFLEELLSAETEELLTTIGMEAVKTDGNVRTPCVFSDGAALSRLREIATEEVDTKITDKFLKTV